MSGDGFFVNVEGIDGAGKTTLLNAMREANTFPDAVYVKQPGQTALGERLREILLHGDVPLAPDAELLLFAADGAQLLREVVRPALAKGAMVLCDRGWVSNVLYQTFGAKNLLAREVYDAVYVKQPPDVVFVLRLPWPEVMRRRAERGKGLDNIERRGLTFLKSVWRAYEMLGDVWSGGGPIIHLDATQPTETLISKVERHVERLRGV